MSDQPKKRLRPQYKLMTKAEQEALAQRQEAERLGRVAFHHGKASAACPYAEGDPLRQEWLNGLDQASKRKLRLDMSPARAKGNNAFNDGLTPQECPLNRSTERTEWHEGWERARKFKEKQDERFR
jgi:ribosome modulation factor